MKKLFLFVFTIIMISFSVAAQDSSAIGKPDNKALKAAYKGGKREKKDKMKALNLTDAQKKEMKENRMEFRAKMDAIDKDQSLTETQKNEKKATLKKEQRTSTQAMLTPEQKTKMAQEKKKNHAEVKEQKEKKNG